MIACAMIDKPLDETPLDDETRWRIALAKDRRFDGRFVTGVLTTGIYCRPSCAARHLRSPATISNFVGPEIGRKIKGWMIPLRRIESARSFKEAASKWRRG